MRAIVISTKSQVLRDAGPRWGELSPLVDRPFLQHVVESIVDQGIRKIDFVFKGPSQQVRDVLGDGTRWGANFIYHTCRPGADVYSALLRFPWTDPAERVLLAHSDCLPVVDLAAVTSVPTLFCWRDEQLLWTGWSVIGAADTGAIAECANQLQLFSVLEAAGEAAYVEGPPPLMARSHRDLIEANRRVLGGEFPSLLLGGREVRPGVWVARNVSMHSTAKLIAPAFLGENCRVGAMTQIGPAASIGRDCLIERETFISDSVVCCGSYVGEHLALQGVVVDHSWLVNPRLGAELEDIDDLLLGSVFGLPWGTRVSRAFARVLALLAFGVALPTLVGLYLGSLLRIFPALKRESVVRAPTGSEPYRWKTFGLWGFGPRYAPAGDRGWVRDFFFHFLPGLMAVVAGNLGFVGPRAFTKTDLENLSDYERSVYLESRPGIWESTLADEGSDLTDFSVSDAPAYGWRRAISVGARYAGFVLRDSFFSLVPFIAKDRT